MRCKVERRKNTPAIVELFLRMYPVKKDVASNASGINANHGRGKINSFNGKVDEVMKYEKKYAAANSPKMPR